MAPGGRVLVGRDDELRVLGKLLALRGRRVAHVVALSGEPGIGKTRLLTELAARGVGAGRLVLEGRATEYERDVPFAVFVDALDDYLGSLHPRQLERLGEERLAELARAFPALGEFAQERAALGAERYRLHRAVRALLELLAGATPELLVLDDVHWADRASIELLLHLLRHPPRADALLALAYRPAQVDRELATELASASAGGEVTLVGLGPLAEAEVAALLAVDGRDDGFQAVYRLSGGNPFFAEQLARFAEDGRRLEAAGQADEGVPASVAAAIVREVAELAPHARSLLEGAAVVGDPFDLHLAAAVAGVDAGEAASLLDDLLALELVRTTDVPTRFRFRHPIVRRAVYDGSGRGWRLGAHARAADELARRGASPLQRAHHAERSARPGDEAAIAVLQEAAAAAAPRAPAAAARWLEAVLRLLPHRDRQRRLELLIQLAHALLAVGRLGEARTYALEALDLAPLGAVRQRLRLLEVHANIESFFRGNQSAEPRLLEVLDYLPDDALSEAAQIEAGLACDAAWGGNAEAALERGERARALAEASADPVALAVVVALLAFRDAFLGRFEPGRAHVAEAARLIDALSDEQLVAGTTMGGAGAILPLGLAECWLDVYADALRHLDRSIVIARATGEGTNLVPVLGSRGTVLVTLGRVSEGLDAATEAVEAGRLTGSWQLLVLALYYLGLAAIEAGDLPCARRAAEEGCAAGDSTAPTLYVPGCKAVLALAELEQGNPTRCRELLYEAGAPDFRRYPRVRALWLEALVRANLALGLAEEARAVADRAERAAGSELPAAGAAVRRARAHVLLAEGRSTDAAELALAAAERAGACAARIDAARSRVLAGRALIAAGERELALSELETAYAELEQCGAAAWRDEAARELRGLGRRVSRQGRRGDGTLSGRELEVAELVAAGRTNKEIARALFVSEKTVEKQLRSVFTKLGVSRRAAVAARLAEERERVPA